MNTTLSYALTAVAAVFDSWEAARSVHDAQQARKRLIEERIRRLQLRLEKLEAKRHKLDEKASALNPHGSSSYLKPIAEAMLPYFPGAEYRIRGPYGLGNTSAISFFDPSKGETDEGMLGWLQFRAETYGEKIYYVDVSTDNGRYPPKSLGALNGLNNPSVPLTPDMPIEELVRIAQLAC